MEQSPPQDSTPNGSAMAAVLAAGIGGAALGLAVLLHEAGILSMPALYAPAGGLSGRATAAVVVWLIAWVVLNARWAERELPSGKVLTWTLALVGFSLLATFPPVWGLL